MATVVVVTVLWWAGTRGLTGSELVTARLDALRVGLSIAVGGGGVFALHLAWRRQRATEADLDNRERALAHQERVAAAAEKDAELRRVTDLYTKAAELLGSDKAAVRLAGIHAMARLAQENPEQRETVVDVWCAYLRMPFTPPDEDAAPGVHEEQQVRLTVQRLLARHLRPASPGFWPGRGLDLAGATLVNLDFSGCEIDWAYFRGATFVGPTMFRGTTFTSSAGFGRATFADEAYFEQVTCRSNAVFRFTRFTGEVRFTGATFERIANFTSATFEAPVHFDQATFAIPPDLADTTFRHGGAPRVET
jgi:uncharacterized protein YjbI with pentapeptide repeats